jgi:hypothetical protein
MRLAQTIFRSAVVVAITPTTIRHLLINRRTQEAVTKPFTQPLLHGPKVSYSHCKRHHALMPSGSCACYNIKAAITEFPSQNAIRRLVSSHIQALKRLKRRDAVWLRTAQNRQHTTLSSASPHGRSGWLIATPLAQIRNAPLSSSRIRARA